MKKLLVGVMAVLAVSSMAMAAPSFSFPGGPVVIPAPGSSIDVLVNIQNVTDNAVGSVPGIAGMNLYLGVDSLDLVLSNMQVRDIGGIFTSANSNVPSLLDAVDDQSWESSITTQGSTVIATDGLVAKITITASLTATPGPAGNLHTDLPQYEVVSDVLNGPANQASTPVSILPEPVTALLLLVGLPFLRRRHA